MTKKFTVNNKVVLLEVEFSKIGYGYPKLFVEQVPGESYIMVDVYLGAAFNMPVENWAAWFADAVDGELKDFDEAGINYDNLCIALK